MQRKWEVIKLDTNKAESKYMGGQDLNFKIVGHLHFHLLKQQSKTFLCFESFKLNFLKFALSIKDPLTIITTKAKTEI